MQAKKIIFFLGFSLWLSGLTLIAVGQTAPPVTKVKGTITVKNPNGTLALQLPFEAEAGKLSIERTVPMDAGEQTITENYTLTLSNGTSETLPTWEWKYQAEAAGNRQLNVKDSVVAAISLDSWFWFKTSVLRNLFAPPLGDSMLSPANVHIGGRKKDAKPAPYNLPAGSLITIPITGDIGGSVWLKDAVEKTVKETLEIPKAQEISKISWISDAFQITAGKYEIEEQTSLTIRAFGLLENVLKLQFDFPVNTPWEYGTQATGNRIFHFEGSIADVHVEAKGDLKATLDVPQPDISPGQPLQLPITVTRRLLEGETYQFSIDFSAIWTKNSFIEKREDINLEISAPQGARDKKVSIHQIFTVTAIITSLENGLLQLDGGGVYTPLQGGSFPIQPFVKNSPVNWQVKAPPTSNQAPIKGSIVDTTISKSMEVITVEQGTLNIESLELEPSGANDKIVSTGQEFTLKAQVTRRGAIAKTPPPTATLKLPVDFKLKDDKTISLKQEVPEDGIVQWSLIVPSTPTTDILIVRAEGEEENTNQTVADEKPLTVQVVKKADLTVKMTKPEDKSQVGPRQRLTIEALVENRGTAGVTGIGSLKINLSGFQLEPTEKEVQPFTVGEPVTWRIIAPAQAQKAVSITVKLQEIPLDENSRLPAVLDPTNPPSAAVQIETIPKIDFQIIAPSGATGGVVSTLQEFTLQAREIPVDFTTATLKPLTESVDLFDITDATQSIPGKRSVEWRVKALKETQGDIPFTVEYKRPQQSLPIQASFISIRIVSRAELALSKINVSNPNRDDKDSIFSTGQTFTITIPLTKGGDAPFEEGSQGTLQIEVPEDYTPGGKKEILFSPKNLLILHTIIAPKTLGSDRRKDVIKVTILRAPNDKYTNKEAYVDVRSKEIPVTIERSGGLGVDLSIISPDGANDGVVSTGQLFRIQAQVTQTGGAKVKNPQITLNLPLNYEAKGQETKDISLTIEASQGRHQWDITAPSIKDKQPQNFNVDVQGIEENTGEPVSRKAQLQLRTEPAAKLKLDVKSLNTVGGIVKVKDPFTIEAIVINEGDAPAKGEGQLKIGFGNTGVTLAGGETDTKPFKVGVPIGWSVVAPSAPKGEGEITISPVEPWSITDENSGKAVPKPNPGKTTVKTIPENALSATTRMSEPPGATDGVVSTGQTFTVETALVVPSGVITPTSTITVPDGYGMDPKTPKVQQLSRENQVVWRVTAPSQPKAQEKITVVTETKSPEQLPVTNEISMKKPQNSK